MQTVYQTTEVTVVGNPLMMLYNMTESSSSFNYCVTIIQRFLASLLTKTSSVLRCGPQWSYAAIKFDRLIKL